MWLVHLLRYVCHPVYYKVMIPCQSQVDTTSLVVGPIDNNLAIFEGLCNDKIETKQDVRYMKGLNTMLDFCSIQDGEFLRQT